MKKRFSFHGFWQIIKKASIGFVDDNITKLSGSLAFYMVFSMGPMLLIIITISGIFLGRVAVEGKVYGQIEGFVGRDTALQLQQIIQHAFISGKNKLATMIGFIALFIGATSVFAEMQDSINTIWGIRAKPKKGWIAWLKNRVLSFSIIISLGFLLLVSLGMSAIVEGFTNHLKNMFPGFTLTAFYILNQILIISISAFIFAVIFKVLPDAKIKWKDVIAGALATTFLFLLGKFAISFYISKSNIGTTYGTAGSLIVLILWIYYSAIILYFGAEFTKAYAVRYGDQIHPSEYAVTIKQVEVEKGKMSIQEKEASTKTQARK
jgi:membrane protein